MHDFILSRGGSEVLIPSLRRSNLEKHENHLEPFVKKKQWYYFKSGVKKFLRQHPTFGRFIRRTRCLCLTTDLNYLAIRGEDWCIRSEDSESDSDVEMMPVEAPIILPVH